MNIATKCVKSYEKHKHLKTVGKELGVPWQTVYVHLKNSGVAVTGDKLRYGSNTDKLAARGENYFQQLVPYANNHNETEFQSKIDFDVTGSAWYKKEKERLTSDILYHESEYGKEITRAADRTLWIQVLKNSLTA